MSPEWRFRIARKTQMADGGSEIVEVLFRGGELMKFSGGDITGGKGTGAMGAV